MLVSHRKGFIYLKTQKTAGTSTESYFEEYCMPEGAWKFSHYHNQHESDAGIVGVRDDKITDGVRQLDNPNERWDTHIGGARIKERLEPEVWNSYFKFCNVRNPFDVLVSRFFFEIDLQNLRHIFQQKKDHRIKYRLHRLKHLGRVRKDDPIVFIEKFRIFAREFLTKHIQKEDYPIYVINGEVCVDYFIRYENLETGIKYVCEKLDIPFRPERIPKLKSGIRDTTIDPRMFYDDETISLVNEVCRFELETFNYSFENFLSRAAGPST